MIKYIALSGIMILVALLGISIGYSLALENMEIKKSKITENHVRLMLKAAREIESGNQQDAVRMLLGKSEYNIFYIETAAKELDDEMIAGIFFSLLRGDWSVLSVSDEIANEKTISKYKNEIDSLRK